MRQERWVEITLWRALNATENLVQHTDEKTRSGDLLIYGQVLLSSTWKYPVDPIGPGKCLLAFKVALPSWSHISKKVIPIKEATILRALIIGRSLILSLVCYYYLTLPGLGMDIWSVPSYLWLWHWQWLKVLIPTLYSGSQNSIAEAEPRKFPVRESLKQFFPELECMLQSPNSFLIPATMYHKEVYF